MPLPFASSTRSVREVFPRVPPIKFHLPSEALPIPEQLVGLELEMENVPSRLYRTPIPNWTTHQDGSLRGSGIEFVTDGPICGDVIPEAIDALIERVRTTVPSPSTLSSFRTSTHVHLDFTRAAPYSHGIPADSYNNAKQFVLSYYALEDNFFRVAGEPRRMSGYCFPFSYVPADLVKFLASNRATNPARYYGCNFNSLGKYGTVEFRHLPLVTEAAPLMRWVRALMKLKRFTYLHCLGNSPDVDFLERNDGLEQMAQYVFEEFPANIRAVDHAVVRKRMDVLAARLEYVMDKPEQPAAEEPNEPSVPDFGINTGEADRRVFEAARRIFEAPSVPRNRAEAVRVRPVEQWATVNSSTLPELTPSGWDEAEDNRNGSI